VNIMRATGTNSVAGSAARRGISGGPAAPRAAFTLVELLVTMVIIAILAALSLAGLAGVRQRAKADKTRNTIRKIDAVIRPMYDSYRTRRVLDLPAVSDRLSAAVQLLEARRRLITYEMPDRWEDVALPAAVVRNASGSAAVPPGLRTAPVRSYAAAKALASPSSVFGAAECLYLILERSGYESDALEFFRPDEIGDLDQDGRPEFLDGWGRPIAFLRWAPGFTSAIQVNAPPTDSRHVHDPMDPMRLDAAAYALVPLIYSAGPDGATAAPTDDQLGYGLQDFLPISQTDKRVWTNPNRNIMRLLDGARSSSDASSPYVGTPLADGSALDNITNHDLLKK
jgi:prepilin-type N-terminal cleavage/methylation domain-containing protein